MGALPASVAYRVAVWTQEFLPTIGHNIVTGYGPELPPGAVWQYTESQYVTLAPQGRVATARDLRVPQLVAVCARLAAEPGDRASTE